MSPVVPLESLALKTVVELAGSVWGDDELDVDFLRDKLQTVSKYFSLSANLQRKLNHVMVANYRPLTLGHAVWLLERGLDHLDLSCAFSNISFGSLVSLLSPTARLNLVSLNCTICWLHSHEFLPASVLDLVPWFPRLRHLWLSYTLCHVNTLGLLVKHCKQLTTLTLTGCDISDSGIQCLWQVESSVPTLTYLDVRGTEVTSLGVASALHHLPKLQEVLYERMIHVILALEHIAESRSGGHIKYQLRRIHFNLLPVDPYPSSTNQDMNERAIQLAGFRCRLVRHLSLRMHSPAMPAGMTLESFDRLTHLELHFMDGNAASFTTVGPILDNLGHVLEFLSLRNIRNVPVINLILGFDNLRRLHLSGIYELFESFDTDIPYIPLKRLELSSVSANLIANLLSLCINVNTLWLHSIDVTSNFFTLIIMRGGLFCLRYASFSYCSIHSSTEINQLINYCKNLKLLNLHQNAWPVNVVGADWIARNNRNGIINTSFMNNLFSEGLHILCPFWACETCQLFRHSAAMNSSVNFMDSIQRLRIEYATVVDENSDSGTGS